MSVLEVVLLVAVVVLAAALAVAVARGRRRARPAAVESDLQWSGEQLPAVEVVPGFGGLVVRTIAESESESESEPEPEVQRDPLTLA